MPKLRSALMKLAANSAASGLLKAMSRRPSLKVLVYHHVSSDQMGSFRRQIELVARHYTLIDPQSFVEMLEEKRPAEGVLLTFDDGYRSHEAIAREILDPMGIRALFFVPSGFVDAADRDQQRQYISSRLFRGRIKPQQVPDEVAPITWDGLHGLLAGGHTIGAHTVTHRRLSELVSEDSLAEEIVGGGNRLAERLGTVVEHFAFPFGSVDDIHRDAIMVIRQRYKSCFSSVRGDNAAGSSKYAILRDPVSLNDPIGSVRFIIENGLSFYYRKRARRLLDISS